MDRTGSTAIGKKSKYKITNLIAKGGMGTVYSCIDDRNNEYAIKFFPGSSPMVSCTEHGCDDYCAYRDKLIHEGHVLEQLALARIKNVIRFIDDAISTSPADYFYVMEKISGQELKDKIGFTDRDPNGKPLEQNEVIKISTQLLEIIDSLHKVNTIHRDLKPHNIMVKTDGSIILLDFGTAKQGSFSNLPPSTTQSGHSVIGTHGYSCHHTVLDGKLHPQCDLFSIGKILFTMITGKDARSVVYKQHATCRDSQIAYVLSTKAKNLIKTHSTKEFADFISQLDDPDHKIIHTASHALQLLQNVKPKTSSGRLGGIRPSAPRQAFITLEGRNYTLSQKTSGSLIGSIHDHHICEIQTRGLRCNKPHEGDNIFHGRNCPSGCRCHTNLAHFLPRHHVRIWKDPATGQWSIMNLVPDDPSGIRHANSNHYTMLDILKPYILQDDDEVALDYTAPPDQPSQTFSFHTH